MRKILLSFVTMVFVAMCLTSCGSEPDLYAYKIGLTAQEMTELTGVEPEYTDNGKKVIMLSPLMEQSVPDICDYSILYVMYYFDEDDLVDEIWITLMGQPDRGGAVAKNLGKIYGKFEKINEHQYSTEYKTATNNKITVSVIDYMDAGNGINVVMRK